MAVLPPGGAPVSCASSSASPVPAAAAPRPASPVVAAAAPAIQQVGDQANPAMRAQRLLEGNNANGFKLGPGDKETLGYIIRAERHTLQRWHHQIDQIEGRMLRPAVLNQGELDERVAEVCPAVASLEAQLSQKLNVVFQNLHPQLIDVCRDPRKEPCYDCLCCDKHIGLLHLARAHVETKSHQKALQNQTAAASASSPHGAGV